MNLEWLSDLLGLAKTGQDITVLQAVLRAVVIYAFTLLALKFGKRRMMAKSSPLDIVVLIILGSVISRAVNGSAAFFPSMAAAIALILIHRLLAWMAARHEAVANFVEGKSNVLFRNGAFDRQAMLKHDVTEQDVLAALRHYVQSEDLGKIKIVMLETNGELGVVKQQSDASA
jgi:uncharacterized membrane protein YcaP (DUF421 family)